jgi:uncharacterized protein
MQYRSLGKTGLRVSALGFGAMRLPFDDPDRCVAILRRAFDHGVNYVDTAYVYGGGGNTSESIVGRALGGYRDRVIVVTKVPTWKVESAADYRSLLEEQLGRLGVDTIGVYLFHDLTAERLEQKVLKLGLWEEAQRARDAGLIRHIGFSFHDQPEVMNRIVDTGFVELVLCQYNLIDRKNQAAMRYAREHGVGVVVMGPVGGGKLGGPSRTVQAMLPSRPVSTPALALRFVLSNPDVSCVLSGMGTEQMVDENVAIASDATQLSGSEIEQIERSAQETARLADLYCTDCKYCMPCPHEVNIPLNFQLMNLHRVYDVTDYARAEYAKIGTVPWMSGKRAGECTECGECEPKCPQQIPIREQLQETARTLG